MFFILLLVLQILVISISGFSKDPQWIMSQHCIRAQGQSLLDPWPDPKNNETPFEFKSTPKRLTNGERYLKEAWPYLAGKEVCWNDDQVLIMYNNFKSIDSLFGNWLICSLNLKRFWCEYTCSPYQYYFK